MRELREELGVTVRPLERVPGEWPLTPDLVLHVWTAVILDGTPRPLQDHDELRWVTADEAPALDWLPADRPFIPRIAALSPPGSAG